MTNPSKAVGKRAAVIGLGRMGQRHVEAVEKCGMKVVGVSDVAAQARETARTRFKLDAGACFADGHEMLRAVQPEVVVVATTAPTHAPFVIAAAQAGASHILCEKPVAVSLAEADAMIEACRQAGALLAVNHQMSFMDQYTVVKPLIGSAELGPLVSVLVGASNFGLAMNGCHYFEMFRYIAGSPVKSVQAWLDSTRLANPRGAEFEDHSGRLLARNAAGQIMFLDFSVEAGSGMHVIYTCRLGQIVVDELNGVMRVIARKAEHRELPTTRYGSPTEDRVEKIRPADVVGPTVELLEAMLNGRAFPDGKVGAQALACCVAAHVSHEAGGREIFTDDPALPRDRRFKWA